MMLILDLDNNKEAEYNVNDSGSRLTQAFSLVLKMAQTYPVATVATAGALLGSSWCVIKYLQKERFGDLDHEIHQVLLDHADFSDHLVRPRVQFFVERYLKSENSKDNMQYISSSWHDHITQKILHVFDHNTKDTSIKMTMIRNVLSNFNTMIKEVEKRFYHSRSSNELSSLGVLPNESLSKIQILGVETHNNGRLPVCALTTGSRKLVYKPRSMLPENLICGKNGSIYEDLDLDTYEIVCCSDDAGEYGFCEYLENSQKENTVETVDDLRTYLKKVVMVEAIAEKLGISDLHFQNIITCSKTPFITDAECFLNPEGTQIPAFEEVIGFGRVFSLNLGDKHPTIGKNRVWFSEALLSQLPPALRKLTETKLSKELLSTLGLKIEEIDFDLSLAEQRIDQAKIELEKKLSRFVSFSTKSFDSIMQFCPKDHNNLRIGAQIILDELRQYGCVPLSSVEESIAEGFRKDVLNNDVPVIYYSATDGRVFYHGTVIAQKEDVST